MLMNKTAHDYYTVAYTLYNLHVYFRFWSALADPLSCRVQDDDDEDMSGQAMVGQAVPGTLASGNGNDDTDSQVVLGVANVHVDAVLL